VPFGGCGEHRKTLGASGPARRNRNGMSRVRDRSRRQWRWSAIRLKASRFFWSESDSVCRYFCVVWVCARPIHSITPFKPKLRLL
jgi:hypothetical protein